MRSIKNAFKAVLLLAVGVSCLVGCAIDEQAKQKATIHLRMGYQNLQEGDSTSALRELLLAEKFNPKDPEVQFGLGWAYSAKGRFLQALEHFRQTLVLDPKFTEAKNAMGATYLEMGKWDEAIQEFEAVLKDILYMTPFYVLNNIGWAHYKKGDRPKAIEYYKKAVAMKPDFGLAYYNLGLAYKNNQQTEEAIAAMRSALAQAPNFLEAHFQLGLLYFNSGRRAEARKSFEEVVRLAPQSENARLAQQYLDFLQKPAN
ncbi:MAG: tetratricopeptide repeat protein [Thermodesulfobacteriota bacterium]|nr:tetratricopeptide repeat protein [Thermodesulfobacteriota bacterium]